MKKGCWAAWRFGGMSSCSHFLGPASVAIGMGSGYDCRMQMLVSNDGKFLVPKEPLDLLGFGPGDVVEVKVQFARNGTAQSVKEPYAGKLVEDTITGLPVIDFGPDAPILTHEQVREMLADFP